MNKIYKKDELTQKYNSLEWFEKYKRQDNTTIRSFLAEFEKCFHKTRSYGTLISGNLLAYYQIKSANLTARDEQLVKATINELSYDIVKSKLIKIFSQDNEIPTADFKELHIKQDSQHTIHRTTFTMKLLIQPRKKSLQKRTKQLRKSHTRLCIPEKKTCTVATETQGSSQPTDILIQPFYKPPWQKHPW